MINETNYHVYLDDFVNGLLDEELEMEFVAFLDKHPNILEGESLDSFEAVLPSGFKSNLKKEVPVKERNPDEILVASMEGDLSIKEEAELAKQIAATPSLQKDQALFALTRLEADLSIHYPYKKRLKKRPVIVLYTRWAGAVAAVFILGMMVFRFLGTEKLPENPQARITPPIQNPTEIPAVNPNRVEEEQEQIALQVMDEQKKGNEQRPEPVAGNTTEATVTVPNRTFIIGSPELQGMAALATLEEKIGYGTNGQLLASGEQTVWQWVYKKVRGRVGEEEIIVPEKEIPRDAANLVLAKVAPVFHYNQDGNGSSIRIGGIEINRRSTQ